MFAIARAANLAILPPMAKAVIEPGVCGKPTTVHAHQHGETCVVKISSACPAIENLARELDAVDPAKVVSNRAEGGSTILHLAEKHCGHAACPVPMGIIKAIEVASGRALPRDVHISLSKDG